MNAQRTRSIVTYKLYNVPKATQIMPVIVLS